MYGKEHHNSNQSRCRIKPGMLVKSSAGTTVDKLALVVSVSPACSFDRDYEGAEEHIFYLCEPFDGTPSFVAVSYTHLTLPTKA